MFGKLSALVLLAFCGSASLVEAQLCTPLTVTNLTVDLDQTMSWNVRAAEECVITEYLVVIYSRDDPHEYTFTVKEPINMVDISFLQVCHEWVFTVSAISEVTVGPAYRITSFIPIPVDADLSITDVVVTESDGDVHLRWNLAYPRNCTIRYRVTAAKEGSPIIEDLYVDETEVDLHFLAACSSYQFTIRAINVGHPTIEGPLTSAFHDIPAVKQGPPTLLSVVAGTNEINMTFRIENYVRNPCEVSQFYVYLVTSVHETYFINDTTTREPVNVTIGNLQPNTMYVIWSYVFNSGGWSQNGISAVQTLKVEDEKQLE